MEYQKYREQPAADPGADGSCNTGAKTEAQDYDENLWSYVRKRTEYCAATEDDSVSNVPGATAQAEFG